MHCHIFLVKEKAIEIPRAIGRAFKIMEETGTVPAPMSATATAAPPGEVTDSTSTQKAFDAFYLGNEKVDSTVGNAVVAQAIERLEDSRHRQSGASKGTKRDTRGDAVTIVVNEHSIRTVERLSGETIMHEYITNVSFTCVPSHDKNKDMFAYICQNESVGIINCHIFHVASDLGKMINDSVRSAVRITHEKLRKKGANPFGDANEDEDEDVSEEAKEAKFLKALQKGKLNEERLNSTYMEQQTGALVEYGQCIQLRHRKSQKYLTVDDAGVANVERDNLRVYLSNDGSALSWFILSPYYKIDREGEQFVSKSAVFLKVSMRPKEAIRHSAVKINKVSDRVVLALRGHKAPND